MTAAVALWTRLQMNSNELKHPTLGREFPQKMGTCCLASPKMLTQWIVEKKTVAMIIISFYIPLPISICTISSISAIVACILTTYITPPTIIEVWNEHVIYVIYIYNWVASLRGIWFPRGGILKPLISIPIQIPAFPSWKPIRCFNSERAGCDISSATHFKHTGPLQLVSTEVKCLGLWNVTTFD